MANSKISPTSNQTSKKNWRGLAFLVLVLVVTSLSIYSVIAWMSDEKQRPLSNMLIEGKRHYVTEAEIRAQIHQLGPLESFMSQDVDRIQEIVAAMPWISRVSVRKQWPHTLKINVTEHNPVAIWNDEQLLNDMGKVFDANPNDIKQGRLISLEGPKGSEQDVIEAWIALSEILQKTRLNIGKLVLNERGSWRIETTNAIRIELGSESRTERLQRFVKLFNDIKATGQAIDYVDLRYDTGAAVGWKMREEANQLSNQE